MDRRSPSVPKQSPSRIRNAFLAAAALFAVLTLAAGVAFFREWEASAWVNLSHQRRQSLSETLQAMVDLETGVRGYLLTDDPSFLQPYQSALGIVTNRLNRTIDLLADLPSTEPRRLALKTNILVRLEILESLLRQHADPATRAQSRSWLLQGKVRMDEIRTLVGSLDGDETTRLEQELARSRASRSASLVFLVLLSLASTVSVALAATFSTREFERRYRIESDLRALKSALERTVEERTGELEISKQELSIADQDLQTAFEALRVSELRLRLALQAARMGTFDWVIPINRIAWSSYHEVLWGYSPGTFPGTYEAFSARLHPDDRAPLDAEVHRCLQHHAPFAREFRVVWPDSSVHWISALGTFEFDAAGKPTRMRGVVFEITARRNAEADRERLTRELLETEDATRRHIARDLHDSTAQHLAAALLTLGRLRSNSVPPASLPLLEDARCNITEAVAEIRNLTWLLHPPLLETLGLPAALEEYASGIRRRSGLVLSVHTADFSGRLSPSAELALFRVAQEALANIVRHSQNSAASLRLERDADEVRLEIQDSCSPLRAERRLPSTPPGVTPGVGILGMRERLRTLGGTLAIERDTDGFTVLAALPAVRPLDRTSPEL